MDISGNTSQIKAYSVFPFIESIGNKKFYVFLLFFQLVFIFQGLDFSDEGFHCVFYQQIFNDPRSVEYNFMYWMSGIIGGLWLKLFPVYGLLGLRLGGVCITMLTAFLTHNLLKNYVREEYLKIGILLIVLLNGAAVKDLNYNNISAFFFVLTVIFLFRGIRDNEWLKLFFAGLFLSFAAFCRLANVSGLSLVAVIVYSGFFVIPRAITQQMKQIMAFVAGFIFAGICLVGIMKLLGQYSVFKGSLDLLKSIGASKESTHNISKLIKLLAREYFTAIIKITLPLTLIVYLCAALLNYFKGKKISIILGYIYAFLFLTALLVLMVSSGTLSLWISILMIFAAFSIVISFFIVVGKSDNELKIISMAGSIVTIALVSGADYGLSASGSTALWIGFPIAVDYLLTIGKLSFSGTFDSWDNTKKNLGNHSLSLAIGPEQLQKIWKWGLSSCILIFIVHTITFTYSDNPNRAKMKYSVSNPFLMGVFTTRERVEAVQELLDASTKYVKKNDLVFAYEDIPMYFAATKTRPFIKNSWPRLYDRPMLDAELSKALAENHTLPVIIYQKVNTLQSSYWPDLNQDNSTFELDLPRNAPVKKFIEKNNYKMVWENIAFRIYVSGAR